VFLFLFLGSLLLLAADGLRIDVVLFIDRSEVFYAGDILRSFCIINTAAVDGMVTLLYKIEKRIIYNLFRSTIRTVLLPIYNIYSIDFQSNVGLWGRRFINIIKLVSNIDT
jgi:hypothetical protein